MRYCIFLLLLFLSLSGNHLAKAQSNFYETNTIQEIKIYFEESNWDEILDDLFVAGDEERLMGSVEINGERFDSVGIRYKGFSSVSVNRTKNPFNIKLNYLKDQQYDGVDKIKLSNVIQDPSFIREVLSYEIARQYMPASRANFAEVYINDEYWGLFTNVQSVNKEFLADNFSTVDNPFFKCNPEDLDLDGENSNLSNSPGTDIENYKGLYELRSDEGWDDLYELIDILNNNPSEIESVLNVDRTLWMHAFNYALINFDSYIGYAQNYYLYKENDVFHPILWDLNMSFGVFRFTDASEHFDGFTIRQAKAMDPLLHHESVSVLPRPLMRNLFANDTYRRMYLAHMRTIIKENFENESYKTRATELQALIDPSVQTDPNLFYGYQEFKDNLTETVSQTIDYPGIFDLMDDRTDYLLDYDGFSGAPTIEQIQPITQSGEVWVTAEITNGNNVILAYRAGGNGNFTKVKMEDDGNQNDGAANDGTYGAQIPNPSNSIQYYLYAENDVAGRFAPERAAFEHFTLQTKIGVGQLVINEFMASNETAVSDEEDEFDDWIELYNTTNSDVSTAGLFLSDKVNNFDKFELPDVIVPANGYLIVWADEDGNQGPLHANFKLSAGGETLMLNYADSTVIDSISYTNATTDLSFARKPNGTGDFEEGLHTFNGNNDFSATHPTFVESGVKIFPNPAAEKLNIHFEDKTPNQLLIKDLNGKLHLSKQINLNQEWVRVSVGHFPKGIYIVHLVFDDFATAEKVIKL